jgi:hypothetical protein
MVIDELLLERLSAVAMLVDPVPEEVSILARAAFRKAGATTQPRVARAPPGGWLPGCPQ